MRGLREGDVVERQPEAERMEAEPLDARRVALQPVVHLALDLPAQRLVDEERGDGDEGEDDPDDQQRHPGAPAGRAQPQAARTEGQQTPAPAGGRRSLGSGERTGLSHDVLRRRDLAISGCKRVAGLGVKSLAAKLLAKKGMVRPLLLTALLLAVPLRGYADPPPVTTATDELRRTFDEVIVLAQSPPFRALEPGQRRETIRRITGRLFNWSEMAKRALGTHWPDRSAAERRTFADWFASRAERAYAGSLDQLGARRLPPDAIRYLGETTSGSATVVRTVLVYPRELPLDFLMVRRAGRWEVYDLRVDGVSAADNYRAQFQRVITGGSFSALVERMNARPGPAASP